MTDSFAPLLSVVVPYYNVQDYIRECLDSLRTQTLADVEVILVDDGSSDASAAVAEEVADLDARFRIVAQPNAGLGPARNTGMAHARGRYITFVDSDDIVAPRAYAQLVGTLEETGSDLAAGNAKRFNRVRGSEQSWTHREPFARTRLRTSIQEFPALVADRMVWNKVYRRSFLDTLGIPFPAIRYEDYPVTLPAYLAASSVDILSEHVYFWRVRESGDSITQQLFNIDNARDRVTSAQIVLDEVAVGRSTPEIRRRLHAYFIRIDLVALSEAMAMAPEEDRDRTAALAVALARRLDPAAGASAPRLAQLIHGALLRGDLDLARRLAHWRLEGDSKALARSVASQNIRLLPQVVKAVTPRRIAHPLRPRRLRSTLREAHWSEDVLELAVGVRLRPDLAHRAEVRAWLEGRHGTTPATVSSSPSADGLEVRMLVRANSLDALRHREQRTLTVQLALGPLRWQGPVDMTPEVLPGALARADGSVLQVGDCLSRPAALALTRLTEGAVICRSSVVGGEIELTLEHPPLGSRLVLRRPLSTDDLDLGTSGTVRIRPDEVVAGDVIDDPIMGVATRRVKLELPTPAGARAGSAPAVEPAVCSVLYNGSAAETVSGSHRVRIAANYDGEAVLTWERA